MRSHDLSGCVAVGVFTHPHHYRSTMEEKISGEILSAEVGSMDEGTLDEPVLVTIVSPSL